MAMYAIIFNSFDEDTPLGDIVVGISNNTLESIAAGVMCLDKLQNITGIVAKSDNDNINDIETNRWVINLDSHHKTRKLIKEFMYKFN